MLGTSRTRASSRTLIVGVASDALGRAGLEAAQAAQDIDPNSSEAHTMLQTIRVQMRLEQSRQDQPAETEDADGSMPADEDADAIGEATEDGGAPPRPPANRRIQRRVLPADDINHSRQAEIQPTDANIRVRFESDVERRFAAARAGRGCVRRPGSPSARPAGGCRDLPS